MSHEVDNRYRTRLKNNARPKAIVDNARNRKPHPVLESLVIVILLWGSIAGVLYALYLALTI